MNPLKIFAYGTPLVAFGIYQLYYSPQIEKLKKSREDVDQLREKLLELHNQKKENKKQESVNGRINTQLKNDIEKLSSTIAIDGRIILGETILPYFKIFLFAIGIFYIDETLSRISIRDYINRLGKLK
jgi:molybdopterin converting factor small subunit